MFWRWTFGKGTQSAAEEHLMFWDKEMGREVLYKYWIKEFTDSTFTLRFYGSSLEANGIWIKFQTNGTIPKLGSLSYENVQNEKYLFICAK